MAADLQRIKATIIDGRCHTPRHKQKQLSALHDTLIRIVLALNHAIIKDTEYTSSEAWFEIFMTVETIKQQYAAIQLTNELEEEYRIANGKQNLDRRVPFGCVYIIPCLHTRLYSIIQPLATAIAAGNSVVVELQQKDFSLDSLLHQELQQHMDRDVVAFIDKRPETDDHFFTRQTVVVAPEQDPKLEKIVSSNILQSSSSSVVAVVDRSANISQAAKDIVRARLSFGGGSPYAPDLVLVNEFALKDFCQAAVKYFTDHLPDIANGQSTTTRRIPQEDSLGEDDTILVSSARGEIRLLGASKGAILREKIKSPVLLVAPISSLDDAIDTVNTDESSLLAAYFFADARAAKYLSQFIVSDVSFTNFIPPQLLVGPPTPQGHQPSIEMRYTKEMFSLPSPEHTQVASSATSPRSISDFANLMLGRNQTSKAALHSLKSALQTPLAPMGQPSGKSIGFFEQGLFTGLAVELALAIGVLTLSAKYVLPAITASM